MVHTNEQKKRRKMGVRSAIKSAGLARLTVFRSNAHIYAQIIDDANGKTLVGASDLEVKEKMPKAEKAKLVGELIAKKAKAAKVTTVVFDRGSYRYHGRVKALAESARTGGLQF